MNKLFAKIIAIALCLTVIFSFTACKEVENGSEIKRIQMTIALHDADSDEVVNYVVEAKLYVNFAPETFNHLKGLIESGYYNNVDITNVVSSYFQFGDYKIGEDGKLTAIDTNVSTVKGEFEKAGFKGNKLAISQGALILKRGNEGINGGSKYQSGKATIAVALSSSAPFSIKEYCVFGKILSDDGNSEADKDSMEYLSSLDKILKVKDAVTDASGRKVFYCLNDDTNVEDSTDEKPLYNWEGQYFTYGEFEEEFHYFKGVLSNEDIANLANLTDEERAEIILSEDNGLEDLAGKINSNVNFMVIPTVSAKIVKIEFVK